MFKRLALLTLRGVHRWQLCPTCAAGSRRQVGHKARQFFIWILDSSPVLSFSLIPGDVMAAVSSAVVRWLPLVKLQVSRSLVPFALHCTSRLSSGTHNETRSFFLSFPFFFFFPIPQNPNIAREIWQCYRTHRIDTPCFTCLYTWFPGVEPGESRGLTLCSLARVPVAGLTVSAVAR
ncbi:hypothetical protein CPB84DRAFT_1744299 [Gymnopilus junonius]|uniref:Uncharacterized protein n=1 Tax=Gymnopilus junonius TaxID=109634 RepID=A0A9P5NWZ0_GYMJU|nr:hypothetical protein CPB84DRAFT_1744299 [Gymnopilus junonius]